VNLLFSGGTGFVGRALLRHLLSLCQSGRPLQFDRVIVLSRDPARFLQRYPEFAGHKWLRFHLGDIEVPMSLPREGGFTHILHAAADSTDAARLTQLQRYDQIVAGTRNMLQLAVDARVKRFLLTSSGGVYGPQPPDLAAIPESYNGMPNPMNADNVYGVAKRQAEHLCALYREQFGIETVIARCFAFVGEDLPLDAHFAAGNFMRDALFRDEIRVSGDGLPVRSYMDQAELARWLLTMLNMGTPGRAYNLGSPDAVTIAQMARLVRDIVAPHKKVTILAQPGFGDAGRNLYLPDVSRAESELDLVNEIRLAEAIERAANGIRSRGGMAVGTEMPR
jgi:UDP-glucuronate decarboxylase